MMLIQCEAYEDLDRTSFCAVFLCGPTALPRFLDPSFVEQINAGHGEIVRIFWRIVVSIPPLSMAC